MDKRAALWRGYLTAGAVATGVYYLLPRVGAPPLAQLIAYVAVSGSAALAVLLGVRVYRPRRPAPWLLLAAGQLLSAAADLVFHLCRTVQQIQTYPYWDGLLCLTSYPVIAVGLVLLVRRRSPGWDLPSAIDSATVAVVAALLFWVYLVSPTGFAPADGPLMRWASITYPTMDLLLLVVGVRLLLGRGVRAATHRLLYGYLSLMLAADVLYVHQELTNTYQPGSVLDAGWLGSALLLGAAGLHPGMVRLSEPSAAALPDTSVGRLAVLSVASMLAPTVLLVEYSRGAHGHELAVALACLTLFPLTLARMGSMVAAQRRMATTDGLTGLRTRRFFDEHLARYVATARRGGNRLGMLLLDVDHFNKINDRYGHDGGDDVLREVGRRLSVAVRPSDLVARHGGERFAVLLPGVDPGDLERLGERVRALLAATPVTIESGQQVRVTISVGAGSLPDHAATGPELVTAADRALHAAKHAGRNRVMFAPTLAWVPG